MDKVRLGIIGIGNMGSTHSKNVIEGKCPEIILTAVADTNPDRLDWVKKEIGEDIACFNTAEEMMDSGLIDAFIIAVPHYDHPKYAKEGFKRGLHVMSEKPAGVYTKQVREMNEAAKNSDCVFGMMFNQRTSCVYRKMHELVQGGTFGKIKRVNWIITDWYRPEAYYTSGVWRATWSGEGGGVLLNQCPHNLDLLQWICGMPTKVSANMAFGKWHDIEVEDDVTAYLEFENGATGAFITTTGDTPGTNRFEVTMERGKLVCEDGKLMLWELEMSEHEFSKTNKIPFASPKMTCYEVETDGANEQHIGVLNAFAGAILHGTPLVANGDEGINGLSLSNAMHLSAWQGKAVTLPIDENAFCDELFSRVKNSRRKENVNEIIGDTKGTYGGVK